MTESLKTIRLRQTGSPLRRPPAQGKALKGLGLGRVGAERELMDTPAVRGLIEKVRHLVEIAE